MRPVIVVAGLGRCGTTVVMNMLHAAGLPCLGSPPAFEDATRLARPGEVAKWVGPDVTPMPFRAGTPTLAIWLDRDPLEQARSQCKMVTMLGARLLPGAVEVLAKALPGYRAVALRSIPLPRIVTTFEAVITRPRDVALFIENFLRPSTGPLDIDAMASVVVPRTTACQPGLDIEMALVSKEDTRDRSQG